MNILPTEIFAALSHETRLRCLALLRDYDELCVCDLTAIIGAPQPHVSRHLGHLRAAGLVVDRRQGQWIHYSLSRNLAPWLLASLDGALDVVRDQAPYRDDLAAAAARMNSGAAANCC